MYKARSQGNFMEKRALALRVKNWDRDFLRPENM